MTHLFELHCTLVRGLLEIRQCTDRVDRSLKVNKNNICVHKIFISEKYKNIEARFSLWYT